MTNNPTDETQNEYRRLEKAVARAMKEEEVRKINEKGRNPNNDFRLVKNDDRKRRCCWRKVHAGK